jgi:hypothetical protein
MPTNRIPRKLVETTILKEEEREIDHLRDGKNSSSNMRIGTGQNA